MLFVAPQMRGFFISGDDNGKNENKPVVIGAVAVPFKFELSHWWKCASVMNGVRLKPALSMRWRKPVLTPLQSC